MSANAQDIYFRDVVIGVKLCSASHVVNTADIGRLCVLARDYHRLHTDADHAQSRGFPGVMAHASFGRDGDRSAGTGMYFGT